MFDWRAEISRMAHWKQMAAEHDTLSILPWHLPRLAATEDRIEQAEGANSKRFPADFRNFLLCADGWQGFHIATDLFGTEDFLSGRSRRVLDRAEVLDFLVRSGLDADKVIPIGGSNVDLEVFVLVSEGSEILPGGVVWFVSEEIERFSSFGDFFSSMVNYNARIAQKMVARLEGDGG